MGLEKKTLARICDAECWRLLHCKYIQLLCTSNPTQYNRIIYVVIGKVKLSLFVNSMIIYLENPNKSIKKLLECLSLVRL